MVSETLSTLLYPFDSGLLDWPDGKVLVLGAEAGLSRRLPAGASIAAVQGFRPAYLALKAEGIAVAPNVSGEAYAMTLMLAGRYRALNEQRLAEAVARTRKGGLIVIAGGKTDGISTLRKAIERFVPLSGSAAKYHGTAMWFQRPDDAVAAEMTASLQRSEGLVEGRFRTAPGVFSAEKVDVGSRLLADSLPRDLKGKVADFCAGWGYLSARMIEDRPRIRRVDLYEADHAALECARANVAVTREDLTVEFSWTDLVGEKVPRRYDAVVMNPPFHQGRAAEPDLGAAIIKAAHGALDRGGRLFLVANTPLPYERTLAGLFFQHEEIARGDGFKVLQATR